MPVLYLLSALLSIATDSGNIKLVVLPLLAVKHSPCPQLSISVVFGDDVKGRLAMMLVDDAETADGLPYCPDWWRNFHQRLVLFNQAMVAVF